MNFQSIKQAVSQQFALMSKHELFTTDVSKEQLWVTYLASFPEGSNPIYKNKTEHDCNCCKQFVRAVGNVVAIIDGKVVSIWDKSISDDNYQAVSSAMGALVKSQPIVDVFRHYEKTAGTEKTFAALVDGGAKQWDHFFVNIPSQFVMKNDLIATKLGEQRALHDVLARSLKELTLDSVETVLELIAQNSLYRGEEHKFAVTEFEKVLKKYKKVKSQDKDTFVWSQIGTLTTSVSKFRNTVIGTLVSDLSEGVELDKAVRSFELKVAPTNYKRPTALVTKAMIDKAKNTIEELGLTSALERRYAVLDDITVNNILFADRASKPKIAGSVFDEISVAASIPKNLDKVEEVSIEKFLKDILPKSDSIELMMENRHASNLVSLVAPVDPTSNNLFKWDNKFSWSYNGDMTDSIKERVKAAGGNVTGDVCCRIAWDYSDDLDFHMIEPNGHEIYFSNRRSKSQCGGMLDVDANGIDGIRENPVENIFYENMNHMKPGVYTLFVCNYSRRSTGVGFQAEIDVQGTVYNFDYEKVVKQSEKIVIAKFKYSKENGIEIIESLGQTGGSKKPGKEVWGVQTNTFHKVTVAMYSPNYWDELTVGNKHYFFMLDKCVNEGSARGFFNEYLRSDLDPHRKVIEIVGSKMKTKESDNQLSGLGFSSTQRNSVLCKVVGKMTRVVKIMF